MRNMLRTSVALGLLALVTGVAIADNAKARVEITINSNGTTYINIVAIGPQGQIKGSGTMKIGNAVTYPMTVDSGTYTTSATSSSGGSGGSTGGGGSSGISGTVTLNGSIKKQGKKLPYVLVAATSSGSTSGGSGGSGGGSSSSGTTLTVTAPDPVTGKPTAGKPIPFTGTVTLKF